MEDTTKSPCVMVIEQRFRRNVQRASIQIGSISAAGGHHRRQTIEQVLDKTYFARVSGSYES